MSNLPTINWGTDDPNEMRRDYETLRAGLLVDVPDDVDIRAETRTGLAGLHFTPADVHGAPILYFHGGSWMIGSPETHRVLCAMLSKTARRRVISVPYRLAPEHQWPAQPDDAAARMRACVDHEGPVFVAGDSAGAAMALWADAACPGGALGVVGLYGAFGVVDSPSLRALGPDDGVLTTSGMKDIYDRVGVPKPADVRARFASVGGPVCLVKALADPLADDCDIVLGSLGARDVTLIDAPRQSHAFMHFAGRDAAARDIMDQIALWMTRVEG